MMYKKDPMTKFNKLMDRAEYDILLTALTENRWSQRATAKDLGIHELSVHNKMAKYGLLKRQRSPKEQGVNNVNQTNNLGSPF